MEQDYFSNFGVGARRYRNKNPPAVWTQSTLLDDFSCGCPVASLGEPPDLPKLVSTPVKSQQPTLACLSFPHVELGQ